MSVSRKPGEAEILRVEGELEAAMLTSDVAILERLLSPKLIFTNHLGQRLFKDDDLEAHRSRALRINYMIRSEQDLLLLDGAAVVSVRTKIGGTYAGASADGVFRFTRVWALGVDGAHWQVVAAHSTLVV
jgi:hypothetical protein